MSEKIEHKYGCRTTHYNACDCREAYFAALEAEVETLKDAP
jgi:hypothetical protein